MKLRRGQFPYDGHYRYAEPWFTMRDESGRLYVCLGIAVKMPNVREYLQRMAAKYGPILASAWLPQQPPQFIAPLLYDYEFLKTIR